MRGVMSIPHRVKNLYTHPNVMWVKVYNVGATRVGLQKIKTKRDNSNSQRPRFGASPCAVEKHQRKSVKKITFCNLCKTKTRFCTLFAETTMVEVVVVVVVGGVDNGVLTLGEWLFACVARLFVCSFLPSFVPSFLHSFLCSFVVRVRSFMLFLRVVVHSLVCF
jgi:hypothetical protein